MLIKNYITTAWRNILHHKLFSAINILGLAIGLAAVILISLFVRDELNYDNFWSKADNIYRIHSTFNIPGRDPLFGVGAPGPILDFLEQDFPEIINSARISRERPTLIINGEAFLEDISFADPDIINMFDFNVLAGNLNAAINDTSSIILNQTTAAKYFEQSLPIGEIITINFSQYKRDYRIGAIIEDLPTNSQLSLTSLVGIDEEAWSGDSIFTTWFGIKSHIYFETAAGTNIDEINDRMDDFMNRNLPDTLTGGPDSGVKPSDMMTIRSMNIKNLHLNAQGYGEHREAGDINTVMTFSAIAFLILIIASINFMNLSTARATVRAKEVSLRKVMGASRAKLIIQFLGESMLFTIFGLLVAFTIVELALPAYNQLLAKEISIEYFSSDFIKITTFALFVGALSGTYPAFILSSYRPIENLKANKSVETKASANFRTALVVFQFAISITLFVSTSVVYGQMLYAKNLDLGYDHQNLLLIHDLNRDETRPQLPSLVNELRRMQQVESVTWARYSPGVDDENNTLVRTPDIALDDRQLIGHRRIGFEFFKTYNVAMIAGREYDIIRDRQVSTDEVRAGTATARSIILNEMAARGLGFDAPKDAIGKTIFKNVGRTVEKIEAELNIIGVLPNVHFDSLKRPLRAEIYELRIDSADTIAVRFNGDPATLIANARTLWQQNIQTVPFDYDFAEEILAEQYQTEKGQGIVFATFSGLAIFIASLGLYGLSNFTAERRTKEIGIRKVFGAEVFQIVKLLVWQFTKPVIIANLIAWPLSFYAMSLWLEGFAYRIENVFIIALCLIGGLTALLIAWVTVAGNSYAVARQNPIKALRYE